MSAYTMALSIHSASKGKRGRAIERLTSEPNLFLSAVQIGVTLAGFLSAAFGGATLSARLAPVLEGWGVPDGVADTVALVLITVVISYFSIVVGELVCFYVGNMCESTPNSVKDE